MAENTLLQGFVKLGQEHRQPGSGRFMTETDILTHLSIRSDALSRDAYILLQEKNEEIASLRAATSPRTGASALNPEEMG